MHFNKNQNYKKKTNMQTTNNQCIFNNTIIFALIDDFILLFTDRQNKKMSKHITLIFQILSDVYFTIKKIQNQQQQDRKINLGDNLHFILINSIQIKFFQ
ncbi:hypothetical protein ABPG74_014479 [Tetrahymena malaccensis]